VRITGSGTGTVRTASICSRRLGSGGPSRSRIPRRVSGSSPSDGTAGSADSLDRPDTGIVMRAARRESSSRTRGGNSGLETENVTLLHLPVPESGQIAFVQWGGSERYSKEGEMTLRCGRGATYSQDGLPSHRGYSFLNKSFRNTLLPPCLA
jgi:hypothetical protein